jgi:hypothetical protein
VIDGAARREDAMTHQHHENRLLLYSRLNHGLSLVMHLASLCLLLLPQMKPELVLLILSESSSESAFFVENSVTMSSESAFFVEKAHTVLVPFHSHNSSFLIPNTSHRNPRQSLLSD